MERINSGRQTKEIYEKEDQLTQIRETFYKVIDDLNDNIVIINAEEDMISVSNKIYEEYQKAFKNTVL